MGEKRTTQYEPGWLRHRVMFVQPDGEMPVLWANIEPLTNPASDATHTITIRHRDTFPIGTLAEYRGRTWLVTSTHDPDQQRRYLILYASEQVKP